jgi:hypothetical protein
VERQAEVISAGGGSEIIRRVSADESGGVIAHLMDDPSIEAVELPAPPLENLPFAALVRALLERQGFRLEFRGQPVVNVIDMVTDQLIGPGTVVHERALLAREIGKVERLASEIVGGGRPQTSIRTYFVPGDLAWHLDRVDGTRAIRLLWPIGRPAGMSVTPANNIDQRLYLACMRREHPLLCALDTRVLHTGAPVETLWAHRPRQLEMLQSGSFPYIRDPGRVSQFDPNAISIHRVETPARRGTWHRSSWANRSSPGFQIVITAAAE